MSLIAVTLVRTFGFTLAKKLIVGLLEIAAKRSDNTIDDSLVLIVKDALDTVADPFESLGK